MGFCGGRSVLKCSPLQSSPNGCNDIWSPLALEVWFNYIRNIWEPLLWRGLQEQLRVRSRRLVDNLETPGCSSNGPVGRLAVVTISQGRGGHSNKTNTCVNVRQKKRASDSTSNMNGLSTAPLMCLFISEHIKTGCVMLWTAWGFMFSWSE